MSQQSEEAKAECAFAGALLVNKQVNKTGKPTCVGNSQLVRLSNKQPPDEKDRQTTVGVWLYVYTPIRYTYMIWT